MILSAIICLALCGLCAACYHGIIDGEAVWDDKEILRNVMRTPVPLLRQLYANGQHGYWSRHRVLLWMSYQRDAWAHNPGKEEIKNLRGWHATNITIHAICSMLVFALLTRFFSLTGAAIGAGVFATHPVQTSAVTPVAGRSSTLCALFYFAALLVAILGLWWLALPIAYLALRCKEEAIIWPLAAAATVWLMR